MDEDILVRAWANSLLPMTAMAVAPGPERSPIPSLLNRLLQSGRGAGGATEAGVLQAETANVLHTEQHERSLDEDKVTKSFGEPFNSTSELDDEAILKGLRYEDAVFPEEDYTLLDEWESLPHRRDWIDLLILSLLLIITQLAPKRVSDYL
jgi:hypothetical protein